MAAFVVGTVNPKRKNSGIKGKVRNGPTTEEGIIEKEKSESGCYWNGKYYSPGSRICSNGDLLECEDGIWQYVGRC